MSTEWLDIKMADTICPMSDQTFNQQMYTEWLDIKLAGRKCLMSG